MSSFKSVPLAVDLGAARVRIGAAEMQRDGEVRIVAIASRDLPHGSSSSSAVDQPELVAAVVEEALAELGVRERRAVLCVGHPNATLRTMRLPKMSWSERSSAARYEAQRFVPWDMEVEATTVRVHCVDREESVFGIGAVQTRVLDSRVAAVKQCGLKVAAVDHDALALRRAIPLVDAIIDIGLERCAVHAYTASGPMSWIVPTGGAEITRSIARELNVDVVAAEKRKRILGAVGAGDAAREALVAQLAATIERARARGPISRLALTGNGARLAGIATRLETAAGAIVEIPVPPVLQGETYHDDVLRAAAPDWTLTAGLLAWSAA